MNIYQTLFPVVLCLGAMADLDGQNCTGRVTRLSGVAKNVTPPATSGTNPFTLVLVKDFQVPKTGVYEITGNVSTGRGAGAPVDFTLVQAVINGKKVIDENPPTIASKPPNGWVYKWSIYFWNIQKPFKTSMYLVEGKKYSMTYHAKGTYKVFNAFHRRNYGGGISSLLAKLCGAPAAAKILGPGCPAGKAPVLSAATLPILGKKLELSITGPANTNGQLAIGIPAATPATIGNCKVYVDLGLPVVWLPVRTNATGAWSLSGLVPDNRALIGIALGCQGLLASAAPLGFDLTNGLRVTAGY